MVHGQGLGDLEEPDQLEPVQALGAGLVAVDLRQACVDGRVGGDEAVDVGEPEVAADGVHRGDDGGVHQPRLAEVADVELDVGSLDPDQRVQSVGLAPGEPPSRAGSCTGGGCARRTGPGRRPPPAGRSTSSLARRAAAWSWTWVTSRGDTTPGPDHARRHRSPGTWNGTDAIPQSSSRDAPQAAKGAWSSWRTGASRWLDHSSR